MISMWCKASEAQRCFSLFSTAASFAGAFGGLLASVIGNMESIRGYHAWRWVFILEGIFICVLSVDAHLMVADFSEYAKWLSADEHTLVMKRLVGDEGNSGVVENITWKGVFRTFEDWKMLPGALMYFGPAISAYGEL